MNTFTIRQCWWELCHGWHHVAWVFQQNIDPLNSFFDGWCGYEGYNKPKTTILYLWKSMRRTRVRAQNTSLYPHLWYVFVNFHLPIISYARTATDGSKHFFACANGSLFLSKHDNENWNGGPSCCHSTVLCRWFGSSSLRWFDARLDVFPNFLFDKIHRKTILPMIFKTISPMIFKQLLNTVFLFGI